MLESLRGRLILWYTLVLGMLILIYAGMVTYAYWTSLVEGLDAALATTATSIAQSISADESGTFDLNFPPRFRETAFGAGAEGTYYVVWNRRGALVDRSESASELPAPAGPGPRTRGDARETVISGPGDSRILVGRPLTSVYASVRSLGLRTAAAGALLLVLSIAGGSFLAARALEPVARISSTARTMVGGNLAARIPIEDTDSELEDVARALNTTFDRLQAALEQQRQFTADASHEFRTPLAVLRAEFDWALKRPRSDAEYRDAIIKANQAVHRLADLSNRLLTLARGHHAPGTTAARINLAELMADTMRLLAPLAEQRDVTIEADLQPAWIHGDRGLLADAFSNLITNAVTYNQPGGHVAVRTGTAGDGSEVVVRDTGIGIAASDLPHIFDRFFRADRARSRESGGSGLGLAIVKAVVTAHQGAISCRSQPGEGSEFTLRFPPATT